MDLKIFQTAEELIFQTLELFRETFPRPGPERGERGPKGVSKNDGIMLAGGRTPLEIYRRAAAEGLSTCGQLFLSDERYVPATDPQSNYGGIAPFFAGRDASSRCPRTAGTAVPANRFIRIKTELPIEAAAQAFHDDLSQLKRIPLGLLGLGADGHTASLFNLRDAALRDERLAIPVIKTEKPDRISVTPTFLHKVEKILILATGADKKEMIQTLLEKPQTIPAGVALAGHPHVEIWTEQNI